MVMESKWKIMTFNIRYDNPADGPDSWNERKQDVCNFLLSEKPDFLGLQEALLDQVEDVNAALSEINYEWFGVGRDDGFDGGEFNPIFYDALKYENIEEGVFWLSLTPDEPGTKFPGAGCNRICQYGLFKERSGCQRQFWYFNTHLDNVSVEAREYSADLISKKISQLVGNQSMPHYLTGDFNSTKEETTYKIVIDHGLEDSETIATKVDAHCTFTGFDDKDCEVIDFIFVRNMKVELYEVKTDKRPNGRNLSDHRPVCITAEV